MDSRAFAACLVRDFLVKHGMSESLSVFESELQDRTGCSVPSIETWYALSRAVDFASLEQMCARSGEQKSSREASKLQVCVDYLCQSRQAAINFDQAATATAIESAGNCEKCFAQAVENSEKGITLAHRLTRAEDPKSTKRTAERRSIAGNRRRRSSGVQHILDSDELEMLDSALAEYGSGSAKRDLLSVAMDTPLNKGRFVNTVDASSITYKQNAQHGIEYPSSYGNRSGDGMTEVQKAKNLQPASVTTLTKRLERANRVSETEARKTKAGNKLVPVDMKNKRNSGSLMESKWDTDSVSSVNQNAALDVNFWTNQHSSKNRVMEHPETYRATMRIMGRDIKVGVHNAEDALILEKEREKDRKRIHPVELQRLQEKYSGLKPKHCALCERTFSIVNLPLSISYKAIIDKRGTWGMHRENNTLARVPRCYDKVNVCHFCSQFFDDNETYRPLHDKVKNEDELLREFQKSIEHLDPGHESAFFRKP